MKRFLILFVLPITLCQCTKQHSGTFVHPPVDIFGKVMYSDGTPATGIVMTDGYNFTTTDEEGHYRIDKRWSNARFIYYSIPADVKITIGANGRPDFYKTLDYNVTEYNFTIEKQPVEEKFRLLCIGDPQVCTANNGLSRFEAETAPDIRGFVANHRDMQTYAITLGDIVHNEWALYDKIFKLLGNEYLDIPNFIVIGNHDHVPSATDFQATATYCKFAGPTNYSFDRAGFHIVVADNINHKDKKYTEAFSPEVWQWLERDLSYLSHDKSVILAAHVGQSQPTAPDTYNLLSPFKEARYISGHNHDVENKTFTVNGKDIHLHVCGTANGVDWAGTICGDGAPMGYAVIEMEGNHVTDQYYKPTKLSSDFQIRMYHSEKFPAFSHYTGSETDTHFDWNRTPNATIFNIWAYDPATWTVTVLEDGVKVSEPVLDNSQYDMWACTYFYAEKNRATGSYCKRKNHMFYYVPVNPAAKIKIVATDEFGHTYVQDQYTDSTKSAGTYE